jgi:Domain of unknown function (DUF6457)
VAPDVQTFTDLYAAALGVDALSEADAEALLDLAGAAAHASERTAAPLSCWLAAKAGLTPAEGLAVARDVAQSLRST